MSVLTEVAGGSTDAYYEWPDEWTVYSVPLDGYLYAPEPDAAGVYRVVGIAPVPAPVAAEEEPAALYRLRDAEGRLLYVGISNSPGIRWQQHATDKAWWPAVADKTVHWFVTRSEALAAETLAIRSESPLYNVRKRPKPTV